MFKISNSNPTPTPVTPPTGQPGTTWYRFDEKNKSYLFFGENDINMKANYRQRDHAFFTELLPYFINNKPGKYLTTFTTSGIKRALYFNRETN